MNTETDKRVSMAEFVKAHSITMKRGGAAMSYQGWTNRLTWNIALWLGNDEPLYRAAVDERKRLGVMSPKDARRAVNRLMPNGTPDIPRSSAGWWPGSINWQEIADWFNEAGACELPRVATTQGD